MNDELAVLKKRVLLGICFALVFIAALTFLFIERLVPHDSKIIRSLKSEEEVILLFENKNCSDCANLNKIIKSLEVKKYIIDKNQINGDYDKILNYVGVLDKDITSPTILYVKNKKLIASLVEVKEEKKVLAFLNSYNIK